jgi:hypothetical protein
MGVLATALIMGGFGALFVTLFLLAPEKIKELVDRMLFE